MPGIVAYFEMSLFIRKGNWGVLHIAEGEGKGCDAGMQNHPLRELTFKGCSTRPNSCQPRRRHRQQNYGQLSRLAYRPRPSLQDTTSLSLGSMYLPNNPV